MSHLIDHRYTILEIERMRKAAYEIAFPWVASSRTSGHRSGNCGNQEVAERTAEEHVRTYMMSGIRPEELEARVAELDSEFRAKRLSYPERR